MNIRKSATLKLNLKYIMLQSLFWMSNPIIGTFATVYLQDRGLKNTQIGIILSSGAILSIILQPLIASLVDKSKNIHIKYVLLSLLSLLLLLVLNLRFFLNNQLVTGCTYILIYGLLISINTFLNSFALEYINIGIDINYGLARGIGSISFALMSSVMGIVISKHGSTIIIPSFIIFSMITIAIILSFKLPSAYRLEPLEIKTIINAEEENSDNNFLSFFTIYKNFLLLLMGFSLLYIGQTFINSYHINIMKNVGGDSSNMGLSIAIAASVELPMMAGFQFLLSKFKCSKLLIISTGFFVIKAILVLLAPNVGFVYFSQMFQMGAFALFTPATIYYVNKVIDKSNNVKGQAILCAATTGVGGTLGNFVGGRILDAYNVRTMLITGIVVSTIGFIVAYIFTDKTVE